MQSDKFNYGKIIPKVSIIILNWNGLKDTLECLESLSKIKYTNYEVIVVDNNSFGNDVEIIKNKFSGLLKEIIINDSNLGFSGGNNVAIQKVMQGDSDYLLLLNNDTIVEPDFLNKLIEKCGDSAEIGILTPMIKYYSNREVVWSSGGYISKFRASGFSYGLDKPSHLFEHDSYCTFASGCCLLIRREVVEKIGLLDERYFLYLEDADFCQRTISAGFKILYVGSSKIYHKVNSSTSKTVSQLPIYYVSRNRFYFARKLLGNYYYVFVPYMFISSIIKWLFAKSTKNNIAKFDVVKSFRAFKSGKMGRLFEN